jgi:hypothetical protein
MCNPVSVAFAVPDPNNRFNVAVGEVVSFPAGSACQLKNSLTAAEVELLKLEAARLKGCELAPAVAVAAAVAGRVSAPRIVPAPFTSRVELGVMVFKPTFAVVPEPDWKSIELPSALALVQRGRKFVVPVPVTAACGDGPVISADVDASAAAGLVADGAASTKAEAGLPPSVSASAAFKA